jgi:NAD-dependent deacetylase
LRGAERIVVFTGAGISAESGIATFRDADGFWQKYPPEQFATWDGLLNLSARNPAVLADFLLELLAPIARAEPNPGHLAIAALERYREVALITQNVDRLHQEAGSRSVREIHGTLFEVVSEDGNWLGNLSRSQLLKVVEAIQAAKADHFKTTSLALAVRPMLGLGPEGFYRPKLVLFGDGMNEPDWTESLAAAGDCDVFMTVGTSGMVFPAAMLPHEAARGGARCIAIDPAEESGDLWLPGTAGQILPELLEAAFPS